MLAFMFHSTLMRRGKSNPESVEEIARRLRISREAMGYTQNYMGRLAGASPGSGMWQNYEKGVNRISLDAALALCRVGLSLPWIYQGALNLAPDMIEKILEAEIRLEERGEIERRRAT